MSKHRQDCGTDGSPVAFSRYPEPERDPDAGRPFSVWAPRAARLELQLGRHRYAMEQGSGGWWHLPEGAAAEPGPSESDYGYLVNGSSTPLPDPRSRRQPHGVHGLSRTFDAKAHRWNDRGWTGRELADGVIYELHIGSFTPDGTFDAAIDRLPYLADLGIDFIEVLPVNAFNGTHNWGYDGVLWYAIHEAYGGPAGYQRFVDVAHRHGIGVIQDVVYNHLGPSGNYLPRFGPYLTEGASNTWGEFLNLDGPGSDEVREYILDNSQMWFTDYHVDGLRVDAVHALKDTRALHILEEMAARTEATAAVVGKPLFLIAESDLNDPRMITSRAAHGLGMDGQWSDDFHHAVHVNLTGETGGYYADFDSLGALAKVLTDGFFHNGTYSSFRGRHHGRPLDPATPAWRLVVCTQNHDQIGNRAAGDRLTATLSHGQLALAAVLNLTSPFTPMLFMGEEYAATTPWQFFTSHPEPELDEATAEGRLREFEQMGWDPDVVPNPQDPETFRRSKLDWAEAESGDSARLLALYRQLIGLRHEVGDLRGSTVGGPAVEYDDGARWLVMRRGSVRVVLNFAGREQSVRLAGGPPERTLLTTDPGAQVADEEVTLPAFSAAIVQRNRDA
ncbi:malto-oligosyltrehalose trehalohydrolase [Arthrobacter castelli]|uniref:malto-oligosyltrehalose trehalohydrolase n=1 Tax=Arthrobacter castelli TaxID=271431 RepID=UPI00041BC775|nr:malto-oligosyltrehalose trehalohydrolase [Arthrobacter castelli]